MVVSGIYIRIGVSTMARGDNALTRNLSPENEAAATYLNKILLDWRGKDPLNRGSISDASLVRMITQQTGKPIPRPTFSSWKVGTRLPGPEYIDILSKFFEIEPKEMYEAFGHDYDPPMSFEELYRQAEIVSKEEKWPDREMILERLAWYNNPDWLSGLYSGWRKVVDTVMENEKNTLFDKAAILAAITEFDRFNRERAGSQIQKE
jgi:hypothetical protein